MAIRVYIEEGGCDRRQLDAATIRDYLNANEYELVDDPKNADRILVVTCAFKRKEEDESIGRLRSLRKYKGDIVVYGCLPDIATERFAEFSDLPAVGPSELESIAEHFEPTNVPFSEIPPANVLGPTGSGMVRARRKIESRALELGDPLTRLQRLSSRADARRRSELDRPFNLFVCRGCAGLCAYCAIRKAIKGVVSKPVADVVAELRHGIEQGYTRFNILGDDPGCYGRDTEDSFPDLLSALFDETSLHESGYPSDRAESELSFSIREIHPKHLIQHYEAMLRLPGISMVKSILCPIQSGSDRVLGLMQREHSIEQVSSAISAIRNHSPHMQLDTQVIVGFPTETDDEFEATLQHVQSTGYDSVVVFPYHDKEETRAAELGPKVPARTINRRKNEALRFFRKNGTPAFDSCP